MMVAVKAIGSIKLRGKPAIQALITPDLTPRERKLLHFAEKVGSGASQLHVSHSGDELLHETTKTLARLMGYFIDLSHSLAREPHKN